MSDSTAASAAANSAAQSMINSGREADAAMEAHVLDMLGAYAMLQTELTKVQQQSAHNADTTSDLGGTRAENEATVESSMAASAAANSAAQSMINSGRQMVSGNYDVVNNAELKLREALAVLHQEVQNQLKQEISVATNNQDSSTNDLTQVIENANNVVTDQSSVAKVTDDLNGTNLYALIADNKTAVRLGLQADLKLAQNVVNSGGFTQNLDQIKKAVKEGNEALVATQKYRTLAKYSIVKNAIADANNVISNNLYLSFYVTNQQLLNVIVAAQNSYDVIKQYTGYAQDAALRQAQMYKDGKQWVIRGLALLAVSLMVGGSVLGTLADVVSVEASEIHVDKSNKCIYQILKDNVSEITSKEFTFCNYS
ncbi:KxYKxGKxW signal peptide domain-containing protein [Weissella confusa]|uniref:KxYKxGKxW signal peptide domain-containing protein n=1 Tax=Weissella confusa TaxID=1583 RepID=A0A923NEX6_WEICO|nr:KxYKxGKxW signal peptide domain-containing protein [Weissella confusa]